MGSVLHGSAGHEAVVHGAVTHEFPRESSSTPALSAAHNTAIRALASTRVTHVRPAV